MRSRLVALLLVAGMALLPGAATASSLDATGWWWRPQSNLLGVQAPPPPTVPEEGVAVGTDVEPQATAGVRYELTEDEVDPVLVLDVANEQNGQQAGILACVTDVKWRPASAGTWEERPPPLCDEASVPGARADDGSTWRFELGPLRRKDVLNVVLVPDPEAPPFFVAFDKPTNESLTTSTRSSGSDFDAPAPGEFDPGTEAPPPSSSEPAPAFEPAPPPSGSGGGGSSGGFSAPSASAPPGGEQGDAAPPQVAPPETQSAPGAQAPVAAAPATEPAASSTEDRVLAILLLLAAAVSLATFLRPKLPDWAFVGPLERFADWTEMPDEPRGFGRFSRYRTDDPRPLL